MKLVKYLCAILCVALLAGCSSKDDESTAASTSSDVATESVSDAADASDISDDYMQFEAPKKGDTVAIMTTSMGVIKIKLFSKQAPKAVQNFTTLAKKGYYDDVIFHRVIENFMIQGGDPEGTGYGGESIWGKGFNDEVSVDLRHFRGALAMANSGPNTNGSQFFIVQNPSVTQNMLDYYASWAKTDENYITAANVDTKIKVKKVFTDEILELYKSHGGVPFLDLGYTVFGQVYDGMDVVDAIAKVKVDDPTSNSPKPIEDVVIQKIEITEITK